ncbi:MAG: hypothetical protein RL758_480 [Pseudomonadota bacterium]
MNRPLLYTCLKFEPISEWSGRIALGGCEQTCGEKKYCTGNPIEELGSARLLQPVASFCCSERIDGEPEKLEEDEGAPKNQELCGLRPGGFDELREQRSEEQECLRVACTDKQATAKERTSADLWLGSVGYGNA